VEGEVGADFCDSNPGNPLECVGSRPYLVINLVVRASSCVTPKEARDSEDDGSSGA
jgi:hypothetical protein